MTLTAEDVERAIAVPAADRRALTQRGLHCPACGSRTLSRSDGEPGEQCYIRRWACEDCGWRGRSIERIETETTAEKVKPLPARFAAALCMVRALEVAGFLPDEDGPRDNSGNN